VAPPANPGTPHYNTVQGGGNQGGVQPGPLNTNRPPVNVGQANSAAAGNPSVNARTYHDRPQSAHPNGVAVNPELEQKHQQQIQQLQQKQDQEYQKLQQKQQVEQQRNTPSTANGQAPEQLQVKQQQELEQLQQKQQQQQQNLKQKQEAEHAKEYKEPAKAKGEDKPHK
jgi:hypothetical protein